MSTTRETETALITGANRGLGRATAEALSERGVHVLVASRNRNAADEVARSIQAAGNSAEAVELDVTRPDDIRRVADAVDRLDTLVNNAGVALDGFNAEVVRKTLAVNVYGVIELTHALLPKIDKRVVNVSSGMGELSCLSEKSLRKEFMAADLTVDHLRVLLGKFVAAVEDGNHEELGWPSSAYRVSKVALNAYTRMLAAEKPGLRINAVCPGWVRTDMGGPGANRSVEEGAASIVWAATLKEDGPTGGFFRDGRPLDW